MGLTYYEQRLLLHQQYVHPYLLDTANPVFFKGELGYLSREGVRKQPFGERTLNNISFRSSSSLHMAGWAVVGKFQYDKLLEAQVPYLLQTSKLGWIPYRLLDTDMGPWSGDGVDFQVAVQSPSYGASDRFNSFGAISYEVSSATRNAEPRPLARHNRYSLLLGQRVRVRKRISIGAGTGISSGREENQIGNYAVQDVRIYQGRGWDTFTANTFQTFQRSQSFQRTFALAFMRFQQGKVSAFAEIKAQRERFEARDGIAFPQEGGNARTNDFEITSGATFQPNPKAKLETSVRHVSKSIVGVDPVFAAINFEGMSSIWHWETVWYKGGDGNWQVGTSILHESQHTEDIAARELLKTDVFHASVYLLKDLGLGKLSRVFLRPALNFQAGSITSQYQELSEFSGRLLLPVEDFYPRPYIEPGLGITWSNPLPRKQVFSLGFSFSKRISNAYPLTEFAINTSLSL